MDVFDPARAVADLLTVRRAFGEPVREGGVTIVPVARVMGGSGGGSGTGPAPTGSRPRRRERAADVARAIADDAAAVDDAAAAVDAAAGESTGSGGGLGMRVQPLGVYVISGSDVTWRPALDLQRVIAGGQAVGSLALVVVLVGILRRRR
ncbi:spore germination protein GerW family protein [Actinotalea sp. AC32]|nr:spore germination protein GerW family protein [Actinotalea sp. AC32]